MHVVVEGPCRGEEQHHVQTALSSLVNFMFNLNYFFPDLALFFSLVVVFFFFP